MSSLDSTFAAIADPTRRALLLHLAKRDATITDLAKPFAISLPAVSKHISVLENAGLIERKKKGRVHHCRMLANPMKEAAVWINFYSRFWGEKLDDVSTRRARKST